MHYILLLFTILYMSLVFVVVKPKQYHFLIYNFSTIAMYLALIMIVYINQLIPLNEKLFYLMLSIWIVPAGLLIYKDIKLKQLRGEGKFYSFSKFNSDDDNKSVILFLDKNEGLFLLDKKSLELLKEISPQNIEYKFFLKIIPTGICFYEDNFSLVITFPRFWKQEIERLYQEKEESAS